MVIHTIVLLLLVLGNLFVLYYCQLLLCLSSDTMYVLVCLASLLRKEDTYPNFGTVILVFVFTMISMIMTVGIKKK